MKYTLLEIVQEILNDLDSDSVNSIDDTVESQQAAQIVRSCYNEMISNRNWPHLKRVLQLDAVNDPDRPNYLQIPENVTELVTFTYDGATQEKPEMHGKEVKYKSPEAFLRSQSYVSDRDIHHIKVIDPSGVTIYVLKNKAPSFWTSFDDRYIVTDSFDEMVDSTLQRSKTRCIAYTHPVWVHTDNHIPDLPSEAFAALIEESKSTASLNIKQMANQKAEQKSVRQQRWLSRKAWVAQGGVKFPDYGRKGRR